MYGGTLLYEKKQIKLWLDIKAKWNDGVKNKNLSMRISPRVWSHIHTNWIWQSVTKVGWEATSCLLRRECVANQALWGGIRQADPQAPGLRSGSQVSGFQTIYSLVLII